MPDLPLSTGKILYRFIGGLMREFAGTYEVDSDRYRVRGAHGTQCPWQLGSELAGRYGAVLEMCFAPDDMPGYLVELYFDRNGLWMVELLPLLRRLAPVTLEEVHVHENKSSRA